MTGKQLIAAPRQRVWDSLNDPATLKACIPGCESINGTTDAGFDIVMLAAVGPVKARFKGRLTIGDSMPPERYRLSFEGSGGTAGFGKGSATVTLLPAGTGTELSYGATAQVGGKLAQVGSRLIDGVAKKMAEDFFGRFNAQFAPAAQVDLAEPAAAIASTPSVESAPTVDSTPARVPPRKWVLVASAIVLLLLLVYALIN